MSRDRPGIKVIKPQIPQGMTVVGIPLMSPNIIPNSAQHIEIKQLHRNHHQYSARVARLEKSNAFLNAFSIAVLKDTIIDNNL